MQGAFEQGLAHHQAGRLDEAAAAYEVALRDNPDHFDALHMLGVVRLQHGDAAAAARLIGRAIQINPAVAAAQSNLAAALAVLDQHDAALAAAERAIALQPDNADAHRNRAGSLRALGRLSDALGAADDAVRLAPASPAAHFDRGNVLAELGRFNQAVEAFDAAVALAPGYLEAHNNCAAALRRLKRYGAALASADLAATLAPGAAELHNTRGALLNDLGRHDEALAACDRAIALTPGYAEAHDSRGAALLGLDRADEALAAFDTALALRPAMVEALNSRGVALQARRRYAEALASYEQAVALAPQNAEAQFNRSVALLALGDFAAGFDAYRWRWRAAHTRMTLPQLPCPIWAGEDLAGKAIVVHAEQGFGDAIQFIRFVGLLAAQRVTVRCDAALVGLFRSIPGIEPATHFDPDAYDFHIPMLDLPHVLGVTLQTIPGETPYLAPAPAKIVAWAERLAPPEGRRRVGLVWAGNSRRHNPVAHVIDRRRSLALAQLAPLGALTDVQFISLQKGDPAAETPDAPFPLVDLTDQLADFDDTAALIANLDLVISVDTAVAHLAGALGKPVWILSRFDGCWRWLDGREDSPWYPTARLFHQRAPGDWAKVIARVTAALANA